MEKWFDSSCWFEYWWFNPLNIFSLTSSGWMSLWMIEVTLLPLCWWRRSHLFRSFVRSVCLICLTLGNLPSDLYRLLLLMLLEMPVQPNRHFWPLHRINTSFSLPVYSALWNFPCSYRVEGSCSIGTFGRFHASDLTRTSSPYLEVVPHLSSCLTSLIH